MYWNPDPAHKYETNTLNDQTEREHPYEELQWCANGTSMYASCRKCGLKSVIMYTKEPLEPQDTPGAASSGEAGGKGMGKGVLMLMDAITHDTDMSKNMIHTVQLKPGFGHDRRWVPTSSWRCGLA